MMESILSPITKKPRKKLSRSLNVERSKTSIIREAIEQDNDLLESGRVKLQFEKERSMTVIAQDIQLKMKLAK
jgi:hypothetical protein